MTVTVTLPICDSESLLNDTLLSAASCSLLVVDNASKDGAVALARKLTPNAQVKCRQERLGRIPSWQAAIDVFLCNSCNWMKWLFAGDVVYPDALETLQHAIDSYPEARLVVCNYVAVEQDTKWVWKPPHLASTKLIHPQESQLMVAKYGNWFGPPLAHAIHREALEAVRIPTGLSWCADAAFCLDIASRYPVLYLDVEIGEFHAAKRQYFSARSGSAEAIFEDSLLRLRALEGVKDHSTHDQLSSAIQFDAVKRLMQRRELNVAQRLFQKAKRLLAQARS